MKKMLLACAVFLTLISEAFAFVPQMEFYVNREVAVTRVWNTTFRPIVCSGQAFGRTYQGVVLSSWAQNIVVYPNRFVEVYVHSNFYDPMVQAWAQMYCQTY